MHYFYCVIIGYLVGSFPTAYLLLKKSHGIDITQNGSGNVGALNSLRISKSKTIGITVFVIDLLKGLISVFCIKLFVSNEFTYQGLALAAAVMAHCYSPWINFKGGRGLATTAGGGLILSLPILFVWSFLWSASFLIKRNIHFASFAASIITCFVVIMFGSFFSNHSSSQSYSVLEFNFFVCLVMLIILSRHVKPIKEYLSNSNKIIEV